MKRYLIAGIIYISSIFIVRAYDETRFFINLDKAYANDTALVAEYNITNMPYLDNMGYDKGALYGTKFVFELNKDMTLKENVIYYKDEILGLATKIDDKLYGEVFTVAGLHKIENNELLKYNEDMNLEKLTDVDVKKMKVKVNKDKTLNSLKIENINYSLELIQNENFNEYKEKNKYDLYGEKLYYETLDKKIYGEMLDKIIKECNKVEKEIYRLQNTFKVKNSNSDLFIIQLGDFEGKREKLVVVDLDKNKFYVSGSKGKSYKRVNMISEAIQKDNYIYIIFDNGNISKTKIQENNLIMELVYESKDDIMSCEIIDDNIYLIDYDKLIYFNTKDNKAKVILKDYRRINKGIEIKFIGNGYLIVNDINSKKRKSIIGKVEGDKINFISEKEKLSRDYETWFDNGYLIVNNKDTSFTKEYSEVISIYDIDK